MRRAVSLLAASLACLMTVGLAPTATAAVSSVHGVDGALFPGCRYQPFDYAIDADKAAEEWSLRVTAYDPSGAEVASRWLWKSEGDAPSGRAKGAEKGLRICDSNAAGRYRLTAQLNLYTGPWPDEELGTSPFTMRAPRSRTRLTVDNPAPSAGQRVTFTVRSEVERPRGFRGQGPTRVSIEKKTVDGWMRIAAAETDEHGLAVRTVTWKHRAEREVRAVTVGAASARSLSKVLRIR